MQTKDEQIVSMWMEGKSREEIAKAVNLAPATIGFRASRLRKAGVRLPMRRASSVAIDVEKLNKMIGNGAAMPTKRASKPRPSKSSKSKRK